MKALGITFSARKEGNCLRTIIYCLKKLKNAGFDLEALNAHSLNINPCGHCNYECFSGSGACCPIQDDVQMIYDKITEADIVLLAIPNYSGHPSGLYRAWFERGNMISMKDYEKNILAKRKGYILISNLISNGDQMVHEIMTEFYNRENKPEVVLLQPREFENDSINCNLTDHQEARGQLDRFMDRLISGTPEKKLLETLMKVGIAKNKAQYLMENFPINKIRSQIEALPHRQAKDPAALLIRSIEENWATAMEFIVPPSHK